MSSAAAPKKAASGNAPPPPPPPQGGGSLHRSATDVHPDGKGGRHAKSTNNNALRPDNGSSGPKHASSAVLSRGADHHHGSGAKSAASTSAAAVTSSAAAGSGGGAASSATGGGDGDFDVFLFLNDDQKELLRDPVLQQMTVVRYEGELDAATGFFHGYGKMVSTLGYTYSGAFSRGLMHGQGRISWSDGTVYEGEFVDNTISGNGKYSWPNGDWYDGDVRLHVRHGKGRFYYAALDETYDGDWQEGLRHGKGTLKYSADGSCAYEGEWVQDRRRGHGVMQYADGGTYDGAWLDDVRHGQGTMQWRQSGAVVEEYRGAWVRGTPSGHGTSVYIRPPQQQSPAAIAAAAAASAAAPSTLSPTTPDAGTIAQAALNTYTGEYLDGKRHGFGTFVYDDGSRYEGQWTANLKHGQGKHTSATGVVYVGGFADGNPTSPIGDVKPETTVACPIPLYIRDVLAQTETNESEAMTAVQSVVSRNHGLLRKVFKHYSALDTGVDVLTTPSEWRASRAQGTMYLVQFLRMCSDCKLITQHLGIVAIDRLLLAFTDRHESTSASAYVAASDDAKAAASASTNKGPAGKDTDSSAASPPAAELRESASDADRKPSNSGSTAAVRRSTGGGRHASLQGADGDKYARPWDRYRQELHGFVGELTFREFVEALVRIAAALYRDPVYGSLAARVQLVVDEHLAAFGCQPANGAPLCRLGRENKTTLLKYIQPLRHCFEFYAQASAMGSAAFGRGSAGTGTVATASGARVRDVTVTVRQLALLLKKCGLLATAGSSSSMSTVPGAPVVRLADVHRAVPYERHEALSALIYHKAFVKQHLSQQQLRQQQQSAGLLGGGSGGGQPPHGGGSASGGPHVPRPPPSVTPSHAPSTGPAPSIAAASNAGGGLNATTNSSHNPALMATIHSQANSIHSSGGPRDEEAHAAAVAEAEAALANKLAMQTKSLGHGARSFRTTVAMDVEMTFAEFVEALASLATAAFKENSPTQRISALMLNYIVPHVKELPPIDGTAA